MASISIEQRNELIALYTAMFNAAPGADNLNDMVALVESGKTLLQVAQTYTAKAQFVMVYPTFLTAQEFADKLVAAMIGSEAGAGATTYATNWVKTQLAAGKGPAFVITAAVQALRATTNADFANAKAMLANKVDVASYFSVTKGLSDPDLADLQAVITGVSSDSSTVTTAKAAVDVKADIASGMTYTLTGGIDVLTGGTGNDVFNAAVVSGAETYTSLDNVNGGAGADTLNIVSNTGILPAGATVTNVETVNLTSSVAITAADVTGFTGVTGLVVASSAAIAGVVAAATTNITVGSAIAGVSVNGGKDVSITNTTAGNISVGATTGAAGNVTANNTFATGTVAVKGAGTLTASSNDGTLGFTNGTAIVASASKAISLADRNAHLAAQTTANTANTAATGDTDAAGLAKTAAATKVTTQATLATDITNATNVSATSSTALSIGLATTTAYQAGAISLAEKAAIDAAFTTGLATSVAAARTAAQAVLTPLQTASTAASAAAVSTDTANDATALANKTAADAVVTADGVAAALVDGVVVTATTNTALATATIKGNYGSAGNAVTDGSTTSNTLTTVNLENGGATTFTGNALTTVNVKDTSSSVTVTNTTAAHTQNFNLNTVSAGTYTDSNATTVNIASTTTSAFAANAIVLAATLATSVKVTGAGINFGAAVIGAAANAVIDASATTGVGGLGNTIRTAAGQQYIGGSGADNVTTNNGAVQTASIDGGAGTADRLTVGSATDIGTTGAVLFKNFETLRLASTISADASTFTNSTFTAIQLQGGAQSITGLTAVPAAAITLSASGTPTIGITGAATVGQLDTVAITVSDGLPAVNTLTITTPVLAGIETLNLVATDNVVVTALTSATALTNVNVTGATGTVSITSGAAALNVNSVIDASAVNKMVTLDFSAATGNGISLKAGNGNNVLTGTDIATKGNSIVSGNGNSTVTGGQADDIITVGNGNNTIAAKAGANVIKAGDGINTITTVGSTTANTITVGNGVNTITTGTGVDTITTGTGFNSITAGQGADIITFGAHSTGVIDGITLAAAGDTLSAATPAAMAALAGSGLAGADIVTGLKAGDIISLFAAANTITGASGTTIASGAGATAAITKGSYAATTGIFTVSASGTDSLLTYDADGSGGGTVTEAVVLIGFAGTATAAAGILTLA